MMKVEAADLQAAEDAIASWAVTAGTTLTSITGYEQTEGLPVTVDEAGKIAEAGFPRTAS